MRYNMVIALAFAAIAVSCGSPQPEPVPTPSAAPDASQPPAAKPVAPPVLLHTDGLKFVDSEGRQVILHGMAVINKSKTDGFASFHGPKEFDDMRSWGMNCIRLGIFWDGIEPEPGKYDEEYLKRVDQRVQWAREAGLYVLLDMHQDLFSQYVGQGGGDGAPEWATLTDGQPHIHTGGVWSDAYVTSPAVHAVFDNFWANKPASDGIGLQDHYAKAWQQVAKRYASEPAVVGYDLMNEPSPGVANAMGQAAMLGKAAEMLSASKGTPIAVEDLVKQWLDTAGRSELMKELADAEFFKQLLNAGYPVFSEFERTQLMPMYQRVADAIRAVDTNHILFLETCGAANMGVISSVEPLRGPDGNRDPLQAYAPHIYDIVTDTADLATASSSRVELIFARQMETVKRLNMPMLLGEWGAYGISGSEILPAARHLARQLEKGLWSDTYWEFGKHIYECKYMDALDRTIPERIAGDLIEFEANLETIGFSCRWKENPEVKAPTRIYVPARRFPGKDQIKLDPLGKGFEIENNADNVWLVIAPTGEAVERVLTIE